jgi:hypothetical protein
MMNEEQRTLQIFRSAQTDILNLVIARILPDNFKTASSNGATGS